ncbi:hypothetical protein SDC9_133467 [bioreactor metagenome]|uniref:Uncharacterized protein n=1 Tax=bioreactor metagenome TaxID=1076179 RepID=A0A645DBC8_9ZZZZ
MGIVHCAFHSSFQHHRLSAELESHGEFEENEHDPAGAEEDPGAFQE